jgi:hypothetical protein
MARTDIGAEVKDRVAKRRTGSARRFRAIEGVGDKTARAVKGVRGINGPADAADKTADELAQEAGISRSRAAKVIRGGGGNPDIDESPTTSTVAAGNLADAMDEQTQEAGQQVQQRRDLFGDVVEAASELPDRRESRRGNFGPLEERDPQEVQELGRAAETFRQATQDPIDPTEDRKTYGFDVEEAREAAGRVNVIAGRFLEETEGLDREEARSRVSSGTPDFGTVEQTTGSLLGGSTQQGSVFRGPTTPTNIGREADGEFARPERDPDVQPAPIARNTRNGQFGLDPFDLTSGGTGESLDLLSSGGTTESREIEYGGEQIDLTEQDTDDLESMNDFFKRNIDAEVEAERGRGGFGTSDFAQDMSSRQVEVATELDRRKR